MRHVSPKAKDLLKRMLSKDKTQRCTAREALSHDWFTAVAPLAIEPEPAPVLQVCTYIHTSYYYTIFVNSSIEYACGMCALAELFSSVIV
jgi:serine/threonine protein kinase